MAVSWIIQLQLKFSSMMNTKKRKTGRGQLFCLPKVKPTYSHCNILPVMVDKTSSELLVGEVILQILGGAERLAEFHQVSLNHSLMVLQKLQNALIKYEQMNMICQEEPQPSKIQAQPTQINHSSRQEETVTQQAKQFKQIKQEIGSGRLMRLSKQKSQSCDLNDQLKRRQKYIKQSMEMRQSSKKCVVTLNHRVRISEQEDLSTQIQQLLRRKKELLLQQKQPIVRNHTENSRNVSSDRKQRKYYGQNDEGEAFELILKKRKSPTALLQAISLANIRFLPSQQVQQGIKRKPIVELLTKRLPKKRKNIGDTCALIQFYDNEVGEIVDQEKAIEDVIKPQKGVKLTVKDQSSTQESVKLPNIR